MIKLRNVCTAAALALMAGGPVLAEQTATVGVMSDYIFRGVWTSNASAYGSIDVNSDSGLYFGLWGADIQDGLEYDLYVGYAGGGENFSWNFGLTGYYATDEAFQSQEEINLGLSYGFLSIDYAVGNLDSQVGENLFGNPIDQTYEYIGWTFEPEVGPYYFVGKTDFHNVPGASALMGPAFQTGAKGWWFEVGKDFEIMEDVELGIAALWTPDSQNPGDTTNRSVFLSGKDSTSEFAMVMHLQKTLRLGD
jgi:hypothetical protein